MKVTAPSQGGALHSCDRLQYVPMGETERARQLRPADKERSTRAGTGLGKPKHTECQRRRTKKARDESKHWLPIYDEFAEDRPKTRGECIDGPRPCPWASCRHHLFLDVKTSGRSAGMSIVFNFPDKELEEFAEGRSCALDVADQGGATLEDVAKLLNLTRERIRQVQDKALKNLVVRKNVKILKEFIDDADRRVPVASINGEKSLLGKQTAPESDEFDEDKDFSLADGDAIDFLSNHPKAKHLISARVWRIYLRESYDKGYER